MPRVKRVHGAHEVQEAEQRELSWWFKLSVPVSAIAVAAVLLPTATLLLVDGGPSWLWLIVATAPLLAIYGIWDLKQLRPRPNKRRAYEPEQVREDQP